MMSVYKYFICDNCGQKTSTLPQYDFPYGWIFVNNQDGSDNHFCGFCKESKEIKRFIDSEVKTLCGSETENPFFCTDGIKTLKCKRELGHSGKHSFYEFRWTDGK